MTNRSDSRSSDPRVPHPLARVSTQQRYDAIALTREYSVDYNNCRNLVQNAKRIPIVKSCEREPKTAGTDWTGSVRGGLGRFRTLKHRVRRVRLLFRPTPPKRFPPWTTFLPLTKSLLSPPCSTRCGRRDVRLGSANLRETSMPELVYGTEPSGRGFIVFAE